MATKVAKCGIKRKKGYLYFIDKKGEIVVNAVFADSTGFSEELAVVKFDGVEGYVNRKGDFVWTNMKIDGLNFSKDSNEKNKTGKPNGNLHRIEINRVAPLHSVTRIGLLLPRHLGQLYDFQGRHHGVRQLGESFTHLLFRHGVKVASPWRLHQDAVSRRAVVLGIVPLFGRQRRSLILCACAASALTRTNDTSNTARRHRRCVGRRAVLHLGIGAT